MGLMQWLELVKDRETKEPDPQSVLTVFEETKKRGVLIGKGGLYGNVIRTGMMLNSTNDHVDELIAALDAGFAAPPPDMRNAFRGVVQAKARSEKWSLSAHQAP